MRRSLPPLPRFGGLGRGCGVSAKRMQKLWEWACIRGRERRVEARRQDLERREVMSRNGGMLSGEESRRNYGSHSMEGRAGELVCSHR